MGSTGPIVGWMHSHVRGGGSMQGEAPLKSRHPLRQPGAMALAIGSWGGSMGAWLRSPPWELVACPCSVLGKQIYPSHQVMTAYKLYSLPFGPSFSNRHRPFIFFFSFFGFSNRLLSFLFLHPEISSS